MNESASRRLVDQRVRNRIMDALSWLSEGPEAVRRMSAQEFFQMFFDWVSDASPIHPWPTSAPQTMTAEEIAAVSDVLKIMNAANEDTTDDEEEVINSGWLERISPIAKTALELMLARGCFDEEQEEMTSSNRKFEAYLREIL